MVCNVCGGKGWETKKRQAEHEQAVKKVMKEFDSCTCEELLEKASGVYYGPAPDHVTSVVSPDRQDAARRILRKRGHRL